MSSVLIIGTFQSSRSQTRGVCEDLAVQLSTSGWSVYTASCRPRRVERLLDMVSTTWRRRWNYEVAQVDVYSGPAFIWAEAVCALLRLANKPFVLTLHGGNLPVFAHRWPTRVRRLLMNASFVTTPSEYLRQQMQVYRRDLLLLPNALDLSQYPFVPRVRPAARLIWLRAFHRIYNPTLAARVLANLRVETPEASLIMLGPDKGDGSMQAAIQTAAALGVSEQLQAPGGVPKTSIPVWLQKGDIFLNTTNVDNAPVSVIEAMACGLCVVSTNVGGIPYLLKHEHDALLVPPDAPEAMATAIRRILYEPGLAEHLSRNARAKAENYAWSAVLPQWEHLFRSASQKSSLPIHLSS